MVDTPIVVTLHSYVTDIASLVDSTNASLARWSPPITRASICRLGLHSPLPSAHAGACNDDGGTQVLSEVIHYSDKVGVAVDGYEFVEGQPAAAGFGVFASLLVPIRFQASIGLGETSRQGASRGRSAAWASLSALACRRRLR